MQNAGPPAVLVAAATVSHPVASYRLYRFLLSIAVMDAAFSATLLIPYLSLASFFLSSGPPLPLLLLVLLRSTRNRFQRQPPTFGSPPLSTVVRSVCSCRFSHFLVLLHAFYLIFDSVPPSRILRRRFCFLDPPYFLLFFCSFFLLIFSYPLLLLMSLFLSLALSRLLF